MARPRERSCSRRSPDSGASVTPSSLAERRVEIDLLVRLASMLVLLESGLPLRPDFLRLVLAMGYSSLSLNAGFTMCCAARAGSAQNPLRKMDRGSRSRSASRLLNSPGTRSPAREGDVSAPSVEVQRSNAMEMQDLQDLYVEELRDLYNAEKQLVKALP